MTDVSMDRLKDFNWALSEFDRIIDVILSNLTVLKEEMHGKDPERESIAGKYYDTLNFKIETVYSLLIKLEELVFDTTFAYYRKYHGSVRGSLSLAEFTNVKREVSYIFDSFLMQYKSLIDLVVKFIAEFILANDPQLLKRLNLDSLEKMSGLKNPSKSRFKKAYRLLGKTDKFKLQSLFQSFINKRILLDEIKDYRDYIIHQGYVRHQLKGKSAEGHVIFSYWIPRLVRKGKGKDYDIDASTNLRLDYFCREKLHLLLSLIAETTDRLYDESLKQPYINQLSTFSPELVKDVILKISRKEFWVDKILSEEELKALLKSKGADLSELIEDFTFTEGEKDNKKEKSAYLFEKIYYKPLGTIRLFKTSFAFKESKTGNKPMYSITFSGSSLQDFISQKPELADILDTLHRAGLIYVIKSKEETRYASVKYDLMSLIVSLDELTRFKWSSIQIPESDHFRPRTPEEIEITRKLLGDKTDEYLKERDREREEIQKEFQEWKKQPEHYFENAIDIIDKKDEIIARITHKEYLREKAIDFQNWKRNKYVHHAEENGKTQTIVTPFFSDKDMDQEWLEKLIRTCEKRWRGRPKHFLEFEKQQIKKAKKKYTLSLEKFKKEFQPTIEKYQYLMPVFTLLNKDAFTLQS